MLVGRCSWELSGRKLRRKIKKVTNPNRTRISYFTALTGDHFHGTAILSFVIPTGAQRSGGICGAPSPRPDPNGNPISKTFPLTCTSTLVHYSTA